MIVGADDNGLSTIGCMPKFETWILDEIEKIDKSKSVSEDQRPYEFDKPFDHLVFLHPMTLTFLKKVMDTSESCNRVVMQIY